VPWVLKKLVVGWPPAVELERVPGEEEPLNKLFVFLEDKRLLAYGYGIDAGIVDLDDLLRRVDDIRSMLYVTLAVLGPHAPIAEWLRILRDACGELLKQANRARLGREAASTPSDITPAVNQLRQAFRLTAMRVDDTYDLPAAVNLANRIAADLASPPNASA
jgi:hypothetical protein